MLPGPGGERVNGAPVGMQRYKGLDIHLGAGLVSACWKQLLGRKRRRAAAIQEQCLFLHRPVHTSQFDPSLYATLQEY